MAPAHNINLLHLPIEIFQLIIDTALVQNGLQQAMGIRLVCKLFDDEVIRAICATKALNGPDCKGFPLGERVWSEYLQARVLADRVPICHLVRTIRDTVDYIIKRRPESRDDADEYMRALCTCVAMYANFSTSSLRAMFNPKPGESRYNYWEKYSLRDNVVSATAYLGLTTLLESLIQDEFRDERSYFGRPTECAVRRSDVGLTQLLLSKWYERNDIKAESHNQALFIAANNGDEAMIRLLSGPNYAKYISTCDYEIAILCAAECGKLDTMRFLLQLASAGGHTEKMRFEMLQIWKSSTPPNSPRLWNSVFLHAAWGGQEEVVRFALDQGANINASWKTINCHIALDGAAHYGHESIVQLLLLKGADPCTHPYCHPLYYAAKVGWLRIAQMLIKHGAEINGSRRIRENNPLMAAVSGGHVDIVRLLLDHGADISTDPAFGRKAYSLAASRGFTNVMRILVEYGVKTGNC